MAKNWNEFKFNAAKPINYISHPATMALEPAVANLVASNFYSFWSCSIISSPHSREQIGTQTTTGKMPLHWLEFSFSLPLHYVFFSFQRCTKTIFFLLFFVERGGGLEDLKIASWNSVGRAQRGRSLLFGGDRGDKYFYSLSNHKKIIIIIINFMETKNFLQG